VPLEKSDSMTASNSAATVSQLRLP
jgi:hypothetical protein